MHHSLLNMGLCSPCYPLSTTTLKKQTVLMMFLYSKAWHPFCIVISVFEKRAPWWANYVFLSESLWQIHFRITTNELYFSWSFTFRMTVNLCEQNILHILMVQCSNNTMSLYSVVTSLWVNSTDEDITTDMVSYISHAVGEVCILFITLFECF